MKKLLLIEDDGQIVSAVVEEVSKLGITVIPFDPCSYQIGLMQEQLFELCQKEQFDLALLDYNLWYELTGLDLVDVLRKNEVKFIAFSDKYEHNAELMKAGSYNFIQKHYNSRGFDREMLKENMRKFLLGLRII